MAKSDDMKDRIWELVQKIDSEYRLEKCQRRDGRLPEEIVDELITEFAHQERAVVIKEACATVFGYCSSDNEAQRIATAIRQLAAETSDGGAKDV